MMFVKFSNAFSISLIFLHCSASLRINSESNLNSYIASKKKHYVLDSYSNSNTALKRQQTAGLIPFPRVGRGDGSRYWSNKYLGQIKRREGLIPFPRVGKRTDKKSEDISIMWFNPKSMGRNFQRSIFDLEDQYTILLLRGIKSPSVGMYMKILKGQLSQFH